MFWDIVLLHKRHFFSAWKAKVSNKDNDLRQNNALLIHLCRHCRQTIPQELSQWSCHHLTPMHSPLVSIFMHPGVWMIARNIFQIQTNKKCHTYQRNSQKVGSDSIQPVQCCRWFWPSALSGYQASNLFSQLSLCIIIAIILEPASKW